MIESDIGQTVVYMCRSMKVTYLFVTWDMKAGDTILLKYTINTCIDEINDNLNAGK